jgi:hypothetical protein
MSRLIGQDWDDQDNPAFGFLMANLPTQYDTENSLTCTSPENITVWSGVKAAVIGSVNAIIDQVFASNIIVRSVVYQPGSFCRYKPFDDPFCIYRLEPIAIPELRMRVISFAGLAENWDGEDARPISEQTITTALRAIEQIAIVLGRKNTSSSPSVRAFPDGSIFFKWVHGSKELALTVLQESIEVQRWEPVENVHSTGLWEVPVDGVTEHVEWALT